MVAAVLGCIPSVFAGEAVRAGLALPPQIRIPFVSIRG